MSSSRRSLPTLVCLLVFLAVGVGLFANEQRIMDWWKLRHYTPPVAVAQAAQATTMTPLAQRLFFVNHPAITAGSEFLEHCPHGHEKTVVLGCYKTGDQGIWLYEVTDTRLNGVIPVTAAHEMLHAAYQRLSTREKKRIDSLLEQYYQHGLTDERVKQTIASYKQSEPTQLLNEMHSIFATEVPELPAALETYYRKFFVDRKKVVAFMAQYEGEFTSRRQQVATFDTQLKDLKQRIEQRQVALESQRSRLHVQRADMETLRTRDSIAAYNAQVGAYNQAVGAYNALLQATRDDIAQYNALVEKRNTVALEARQLTEALSAQSLPSAP